MRDRVIFRRALAASLLLLTSSAYASSYSYQTLNNPGDPAFNQLLGINNAGTIVGYFGDGTIAPNQGYTLTPPSTYTSENFPGSAQTQVVGINAAGTTVGFYVDTAGNNFGFVNHGGTFTSVINPNTPVGGTSVNQILGINATGIAVGFYTDAAGNNHGYLYNTATSSYTAITLPSGFGAVSVTATGINNAGVVTGFYTDLGGATHGFSDNGGVFTSFDAPGGTNTMLFGINNGLTAVGSFLDPTGVTMGFTDNLSTHLFQIISDPNASPTAAFGVTGTTVNGINDQGNLVGFYSDGNNVDGFLATVSTVPEPSTWLMLATGSLGAAAIIRRKRTWNT